LLKPGVPKDVAKGKALYKPKEDDEPINFFVDILPRMRAQYDDSITMYEFIQEPGDTVFVPGE
jgi:histone arginine demethylase JMJD6